MTLFISNYTTTKFLLSIITTKTSSVLLGRVIRERGGVIRQCVVAIRQRQRQRQGRLVLSTATSTSVLSLSSSTSSSSSSSSNDSNSNSNSSSSIWDVYNDTVHGKTIRELPEVQFSNRIKEFLIDKINSNSSSNNDNTNTNTNSNSNKHFLLKKKYKYIPSKDNYRISLKSIFITFILNKNARIAALVGKGYYTIGPCGEENLSIIGSLLLNNDNNTTTNNNDKNSNNNENSTNVTLGDSSALHYRHTSISLTRQLLKKLELDSTDDDNDNYYRNNNEIVQDLLLGRARGYTVSKYDPITGGVHCSIGAPGSNYDSNEYIVSSTLASQCPSAIGRALGYSLNLPNNQNQNQNQRSSKSSEELMENDEYVVYLGEGT
jgi:hypothetical protein